MEVTPMLDAGSRASQGIWYLLSAENEGPCPRVGHASLVVNHRFKDVAQGSVAAGAASQENQGSMVIVAGATPSGPFNDVYFLEITKERYKWSKFDTQNLTPRYEHGILENTKGDIYVFGGAQQDQNLNSMQVLKNGETKWTTVSPKGCVPSPRTCLNVATIGDKLYIFGGGFQGERPVTDTQVHVFNSDDCCWTQLQCKGTCPLPRHGHLIVALGNKLYVHGGIAGRELHSDLHVLDLETNKWDEIKQSGSVPSSRAAHAGTVIDKFIYLFGGMNFMGALNDLFKFDTDSLVWSKIEINGSLPPPRLDHTLCCVHHPITTGNEDASDDEPKSQRLLVSFGGMDTAGQIFDDLFAIAVD